MFSVYPASLNPPLHMALFWNEFVLAICLRPPNTSPPPRAKTHERKNSGIVTSTACPYSLSLPADPVIQLLSCSLCFTVVPRKDQGEGSDLMKEAGQSPGRLGAGSGWCPKMTACLAEVAALRCFLLRLAHLLRVQKGNYKEILWLPRLKNHLSTL